MGNCLFGDGVNMKVKVVTSNGGIMELYAPIPIRVGSITKEFPGQGIFRSQDLFWKPLCEYDELVGGESYYLLPLHCGQGHIIRSNSGSATSFPIPAATAPYTMSSFHHQSYHHQHGLRKWKVKLVITPQQLLHILSQERDTQELIHTLTTVAKCPIISDQWILSFQ